MYTVRRQQDEKYGCLVVIEHSDEGIKTPFFAVQAALKERRTWQQEGAVKVRLLIDDQIMTPIQADRWQCEEYQTLPKCHTCGEILGGEVHTHQLSGDRLFCRQACADQAYLEEVERLSDIEESDYS